MIFNFELKVNGCSFVPDYIFGDLCNLHDEDYYYQVSKEIADGMFYDRMLKKCNKIDDIKLRKKYKFIAKLYYYGVKYLGHYAYYKCKINQRGRNV